MTGHGSGYVSWSTGLIVCRVPKTAALGKITVRVRTSRGTSNRMRLRVVATPTPPASSDWAAVSCQARHTLALKTDGSLWAWGYNANGELGLGDTDERHAPTEVGSASDWAAVSAGDGYTQAVRKTGTLWAWGENKAGELGLGDSSARQTPTEVGSASDWAAVSCGEWHTLALKKDGTLWAWGHNDNGELGLGDTRNRITPTKVGSGAR